MITMKIRSFTLIELSVVIIIIGILSLLTINYYGPYRENTFDREAQANLRLMFSAERIWRMESNNNQYTDPPTLPAPACPLPNNTTGVNGTLRLTLPITNAGWNYQIRTYAVGTNFCAQATRTAAPVRSFCIWAPTVAVPDPQPAACLACPP